MRTKHFFRVYSTIHSYVLADPARISEIGEIVKQYGVRHADIWAGLRLNRNNTIMVQRKKGDCAVIEYLPDYIEPEAV